MKRFNKLLIGALAMVMFYGPMLRTAAAADFVLSVPVRDGFSYIVDLKTNLCFAVIRSVGVATVSCDAVKTGRRNDISPSRGCLEEKYYKDDPDDYNPEAYAACQKFLK